MRKSKKMLYGVILGVIGCVSKDGEIIKEKNNQISYIETLQSKILIDNLESCEKIEPKIVKINNLKEWLLLDLNLIQNYYHCFLINENNKELVKKFFLLKNEKK